MSLLNDAYYPAETLRDCALRELAMRRHVYPRLVREGRLSGEKAQRETEMMQAIADLLHPMPAARERAAEAAAVAWNEGHNLAEVVDAALAAYLRST